MQTCYFILLVLCFSTLPLFSILNISQNLRTFNIQPYMPVKVMHVSLSVVGGKKGSLSSTGSVPISQGMHRTSSSSRMRNTSGQLLIPDSSPDGGLSVTGCLADFSLYVFHPYGHTQKKTTTLSSLESSFRRSMKAILLFYNNITSIYHSFFY